VTATGLWMGSDTDYVGNGEFWRPRLAFFPLEGGSVTPPGETAQLPANVYVAAGSLTRTWVDGTTPPAAFTAAPGGGIDWGKVRGAVMIDGQLWYGNELDSTFHKRSFDGTSYGPDQLVDPHNDPEWSNVLTGSGTATYRGQKPGFYNEIKLLRSLTYEAGKLYYTKFGAPQLFYRLFSPASGVMTHQVWTVPGFSVPDVSGVFITGGQLYFSNTTTGNLSRVAWTSGQPQGPVTVVSGPAIDGRNWRPRTVFPGPGLQPGANIPPVAAFGSSCTALGCDFDGSGSSDPDGAITSYAWDFGDGATGTGPQPTHGYAAAGTYDVVLTVTDDRGGTDTASGSVTVRTAGQSAAFVVAAAATVNSATASVTVPAGVQPGDLMLLFGTTNSLAALSAPAGWQSEHRQESFSMATELYRKTAGPADAGTVVTVTATSVQKIDLQLVAYRGVQPTGPVAAVVSAADAATATHTSPVAAVTANGVLAVTFWADKSSSTTDWTPPDSVSVRSEQIGAGSGRATSMAGDTPVPDGATSYGGVVATTNAASSRGLCLTVLLAGG